MKKIPKGLETARKKQKETFNLDKLFEFNEEKEELDYLLSSLCSQIAKGITGYGHSSDVLDESPDSIFKNFAKLNHVNNSSDYEESSDEIGFRGEHYDKVKETFIEKIDQSLGDGSFIKFSYFKELFKVLKKKGFKGTELELEKELKRSSKFRSFCKDSTTAYSG